MLDRSCRWNKTYVSEPRPPTGLLFIPRVICERGEPWWWMMMTTMSAEENSWLVSQSPLANLPAETSGSEYEKLTKVWVFLSIFHTSTDLLTCKMLRHGTSGFNSHPNECMLRIFIALKNPSPLPGLNPQSLGPVASTLTTKTPRWLCRHVGRLLLGQSS
jgi:hypothetical protein